MPTIKEVAALAGVSIATVSNYLNHTKPVSRQTAAKISDAVERLGYAANLSAKSLRSNRYTEIGVILPNLNDPYYVQIFQGVEHAFAGTPYFVNVAFSYDIPELERSIAEEFRKKQVCGLILISCIPDDGGFYQKGFIDAGKALVMIDREIRDLDAGFITFDYEAILEELTKALLEHGKESIVLMAGAASFTGEAACIRGFEKAFSDMRKPCGTVLHTELNREGAFRTTMSLLRAKIPDVVIATSEAAAGGIMEALTLSGHDDGTVPVVTLGEEHWNKFTHSFADFSTARPSIRMGQTAGEELLRRLQTPSGGSRIILQDSSLNHMNLFSGSDRRKQNAPQAPLKLLLLQAPAVDTFLNLLKNFTHKTGIETQVTTLPHHKLSEKILSSRDYDIIMYDIPWLPMLASCGVLRDITDPLEQIKKDIFFPGCLRYYSYFRKRGYGVPFIYAPQIFFYRKDLFEDPLLREEYRRLHGAELRPPITMKEYDTLAAFFTFQTDSIPYGMSVAAAYPECLAPELYTRMRAYGGELFSPHGRVVLDSVQTRRAYEGLERAIASAKPDHLQATDVSIIGDFLCGETAMLIGYPAYMTDVADLRKSSMIGSIGYSQIPGRAPLLGGWGMGLGADCAHEENALAFLQWMCDEQTANYFALLGGQTTVTGCYTNDELVRLYPWLPMYHAAYENAGLMMLPELPGGRVLSSEAVDETVCRWLYRLIQKEMSVEDCIGATAVELEKMVRDVQR